MKFVQKEGRNIIISKQLFLEGQEIQVTIQIPYFDMDNILKSICTKTTLSAQIIILSPIADKGLLYQHTI